MVCLTVATPYMFYIKRKTRTETRKRNEGSENAGPYGKGYPRTPLSFTRVLWAGHPRNGLMAVPGVAHP
jgi:hypothetical protein